MAKKKSVKKSKRDLTQTEIVVLLDRSGSMGSIADATVKGFNNFLLEQQGSKGESFITLVQFDDRYEMNYSSVPSKEVSPLILHETYSPRGGTALLDAIGKTVEELKTDRDVIFVIITDGEENASKTYTGEAIGKIIETLKTESKWKFIFMGANQDAITAGGNISVSAGTSINYAASNQGVFTAFSAVSNNVRMYTDTKYSAVMDFGAVDEITDDMITSLKASAESNLSFSDSQRNETIK